MTYAVDVNVLIYAAQEDSPFYARARAAVRNIFDGDELVYVFWPTVMAFLRISTHPGVLTQPLTSEVAMQAVEALIALPNVRTGTEGDGFWRHYVTVTAGQSVRGPLVPDAHLVALMRQHGVSTIYTHDRDFRKFDGIRVVDPIA